MPAELGGAHRTPGDPVARVVEARERSAQPVHAGQQVLRRHEHVVHDDLAGDRGAQAEFPLDFGRAQALHFFVEDKAADHAVFGFRPHHKDIRDRRIGNPHLGAVQTIAARHRRGPGRHARRVRSVIGFGQTKAADPLARGQLGQVFLALRRAAEIVDRVHDQTRLHAHRRAIAAVDALDLARDQPIRDVVDPGAAKAVDRCAEKAERAHLVHDLAIETLVPIGLDDAREQLFLAIGVGAVAHHALVLAQFAVEQERVGPIEPNLGRCCRTGAGGAGSVSLHRNLGDGSKRRRLYSAGYPMRQPAAPRKRERACARRRRKPQTMACRYFLAADCRPVPRPRPIFLAKAERCSA